MFPYNSDYYYDLDMSGGGIALTNNMTYLLCVLLVVVVFYVFYEMNNKYDIILNKLYEPKNQIPQQQPQQQQQQQGETTQKINVNLNKDVPPPKTPFEFMREYDYRALNDPLIAPRRRDDYNLPVLPVPTRGFPAAYKKVGLLIDNTADNNDRYKILLLMGRNTHPNSTAYEYYAVDSDKNSALKFEICNRGTRELQTDDRVSVKELGRIYTVKIDQMLGYEYDPYIY
jgi:hypothetical protein